RGPLLVMAVVDLGGAADRPVEVHGPLGNDRQVGGHHHRHAPADRVGHVAAYAGRVGGVEDADRVPVARFDGGRANVSRAIRIQVGDGDVGRLGRVGVAQRQVSGEVGQYVALGEVPHRRRIGAEGDMTTV